MDKQNNSFYELEKERTKLTGETGLFCGCERCSKNGKRIMEIDKILNDAKDI